MTSRRRRESARIRANVCSAAVALAKIGHLADDDAARFARAEVYMLHCTRAHRDAGQVRMRREVFPIDRGGNEARDNLRVFAHLLKVGDESQIMPR